MPSRIYAHAAHRIRELRRSQGLSIEELAGRAGITTSYLGQIERMERKPSLLTLARIAHALKVSPSYVLAGEPARAAGENAGERHLLATLAGMSARQKNLALETIQFFLRRLRRLKRTR